MTQSMQRWVLALLVAWLASTPRAAGAYNWQTHSDIVATAVSILQDPPPFALTPPAGVSEQEWLIFRTAASAAPSRLVLLRTGLPNALPTGVGGGVESAEPYPIYGNTECPFHPEDNLLNIGLMRINEFRYKPERAGPCGIKMRLPGDKEILQRVLGWQGGSPDDHLHDTVMWFRPTNAGPLSWGKEFLSKGWKLGFGAAAAPFKCAYDAIFGDGCDFGSSFDLADEYNPVNYVDGWIPGVGTHSSDEYASTWHFIDVVDTGRFNDIRGLWYEGAGPNRNPGVIDITIMVGANMTGLSLNAFESDGDDFYGEYDDVGRGDLAWHAYNVAHTEFSPVDNLARFGWDKFRSDGRNSARGLAWPLHAIADASCPHHVVGTTSFGHRPFENWMGAMFSTFITPGNDLQRARILQKAHFWWAGFNASNEDIHGLVRTAAFQTHALANSPPSWPFSDLASYHFHTDAQGMALAHYANLGREAEATELFETAIAATLGFLVAVADTIVDPGIDASTQCPSGTHYDPATSQCEPGPGTQPPQPPAVIPGLCISNLTCADAGGGCQFTCAQADDCPVSGVWACTSGCCVAIPQ